MHDARWARLKESLVEQGWVWRDDTLLAPHETMWFLTRADDPDYAQFRDRMTSARDTPDTDPADVDHAALHADLVTLVAALDAILAN